MGLAVVLVILLVIVAIIWASTSKAEKDDSENRVHPNERNKLSNEGYSGYG